MRRTLNLQLWKAYADEIEIFLETPSGENLPVLSERIGTQRYRAGETELLVYYGKPGPFQVTQEIYVDFLPMEIYLTSGIWKTICRAGESEKAIIICGFRVEKS